jgi:hypothetical protein
VKWYPSSSIYSSVVLALEFLLRSECPNQVTKIPATYSFKGYYFQCIIKIFLEYDTDSIFSLQNFHYVYYPAPREYQKANFDIGCCVSNSKFHVRCICAGIVSESVQSKCRSLCSGDSACKGYATTVNGKHGFCYLATTSSCPPGFDGPYAETNIGQLDPNGTCGNDREWNGGCMIKSGTC